MHRRSSPHQWALSPLTTALLLAMPLMAQGQTTNAPERVESTKEETSQEQETTDQATDNSGSAKQSLGTVVVTGQRAAFRRAIANKQASPNIMDSVAADDVQQLPDSTVAETIRRIPGVSVTFNNDNVHGRDEAERPVLRGLDARYNNTTIDGLGVASADSSNARGARLDLLPASMIDRLEVYKSWSVSRDPNAIGGATNVTTRSAFVKGGRFSASASGALGNVSNHGKPYSDNGMPKKADFSISNTWGEDRNYGIVLSGYAETVDTYTVGHASSDSVYYNYFDSRGQNVTDPAQGNGYAVPQNTKWFWFQDARERQGVTAKLEAKPNGNLYTFLTVGTYQSTLDETRHENLISTNLSGSPQNQTPSSGNFASAAGELGYGKYGQERKTHLMQVGADFAINESSDLSLRHGWSRATSEENRLLYKYLQGIKYNGPGKLYGGAATPTLGMSYDTSGSEMVFNLDKPGNWSDPNRWQAAYQRTGSETTNNRLDDTRLDYRFNLKDADRGWGFGVGLNQRTNTYTYDNSQLNVGPSQTGLTMAGGILKVPGELLPSSAGLPLLVIDPSFAAQQWANNPNIMTVDNAGNLQSSLQDDYSFRERLNAAYWMAGYNTERWHNTFGLRYDHADISTSAYQKKTSQGKINWEPSMANSSYSRWLPAFTTIYDVQSDLKLRGALAKTLGRPDFSAYAPRGSVSENSDGTLNISMGNPDIKPRESTNIDISVEKYLPDGLLSFALFNKSIKNEIYTAQMSNQPVEYSDGSTRMATVSVPVNSSGARVRGIEFAAVINSLKNLSPSMSNFGVAVNVTLMKGLLDVTQSNGNVRSVNRLLGQPDSIVNLAIFYANNGFETRLAYNRTGSSLRAVDVNAPWSDVFWKARDQVDFSARYRIHKDLTGFGEVKNLTSSPVTSLTGANRSLLKDTYKVGRTLWLGLKWQL